MSLIDIEQPSYPATNLPTISLMSFNSASQSNDKSHVSPHHQTTSATSSNISGHEFPNLGSYTGTQASPSQLNTPCYGYNPSNDDNKAFDDVVFDILKVDPDEIAGQLTLIDLPLFKQIQPDELISCKWMSREKMEKAPNIVQFTRRFNQTTFWAQKEILNCKRIDRRGKMITHFIKMAKRLYELHSFNSLMAIIVALRAQPIHRLRKTWTQHVHRRDVAQFERLADLMFDTDDNKRKVRDAHMSAKLPCIPFLGLFLTDLIHIDIAHPHNSFDNPQRRNQMNNICRLVSEYQQSTYQDLTSISCDCCFSAESFCLVPSCACLLHHSGAGVVNGDGTIYINEVGYIRNYLNSFLYIEELQKFKEDENYRDSLALEPEPDKNPDKNSEKNSEKNSDKNQDKNFLDKDLLKTPVLHVSPSSPIMDPNNNNNNIITGINHTDRKCNSVAANLFSNRNDVPHPLDESLAPTHLLGQATFTTNGLLSELPAQQQKQLLASVRINDPSSLLRELLKHRHHAISKPPTTTLSFRNKFSCYSGASGDVDDDNESAMDDDPNSLSVFDVVNPTLSDNNTVINNSTPIKRQPLNSTLKPREPSFNAGRNLTNSLNEDGTDALDFRNHPPATSSSSDLFISHSHNGDDLISQSSIATTIANQDISGLTNLSSIMALEQQMGLIMFESPVKRKCIMKNSRKPRFSQWKSYWLQLIGGNLLIYYPMKTTMFSANNKNRPDSEASSYIDELILSQTENQTDNQDIHQLHQEMQLQQKKERLQAQIQQKKSAYNKNPCKMHPIANWMVVEGYREQEDALIKIAKEQLNRTPGESVADLSSFTKFDIQLNDLQHGNMYKYRFDSLQIAKEWLEQFKLASTYHERDRPDNLIRFD